MLRNFPSEVDLRLDPFALPLGRGEGNMSSSCDLTGMLQRIDDYYETHSRRLGVNFFAAIFLEFCLVLFQRNPCVSRPSIESWCHYQEITHITACCTECILLHQAIDSFTFLLSLGTTSLMSCDFLRSPLQRRRSFVKTPPAALLSTNRTHSSANALQYHKVIWHCHKVRPAKSVRMAVNRKYDTPI